jgi:hypothetical protein
MNKKSYWDRFRHFSVASWLSIGFMAVADVVGFYFSIAMTIVLSQGKTLFGNSASSATGVEIQGPTGADLTVVPFFWVLSVLVLALLVYFLFFRKEPEKTEVHKAIVNGKTVIITEEKDDDHAGK